MEKKIESNDEEIQTKETQPNSDENINQPNTNENSSEKIEFSSIGIQIDEENDLMNVDCDEKNEEGGIYSLFDKIDEINVKQKNCENEVSKNYFDNKNKLRRRGLSSFFLRIQLLLMMTLIPRPLTDEDENEVSKNFLGNKRSNVNFIESKKNKFWRISFKSCY